ncbi:MAG: TetR family transcriptional regulator [Solirubrobacterales bacterium]
MEARPKYAEAARNLLRDSLLDAAADLLTEQTWSEISMAAIASQAGVSRQTLYNEFGSRDEFAQIFALREADRFLTAIEASLNEHPGDPRVAMQAAFATFLTLAADNPMVRAIVVRDAGADDLFALFTTRGGPVVEFATERITTAVMGLWPIDDPFEVRIAAEALVRLAISHAGLPTGSIEVAAQSIAALIGPFIADAFVREGIAIDSR